jgi:histidinol-phosphate aminotransferase
MMVLAGWGMNTFYLDRNENQYGPAPKCAEILRSFDIQTLSAYSRDYRRGVRSRLTERLAEDLGIPEKRILLSEGSEEMLKRLVQCYIRPGEKLLCPAQSWWYYQKVASEVGGETLQFDLKEGSDRFFYDVEDMILRCGKTSPRVVLIASPNNPTGNSFNVSDLAPLIRAFGESVVVLDEAYWGFADESRETALNLVEEYDNLLVVRTFSKYYALAGARIAFAAAGKGLDRLSGLSERYLGYNRISEELALAALDSPEYYRAITSRMLEDKNRLYDFFDRHDGFLCYRSDANFVLVRIPRTMTHGLKEFLAGRGIIVKFISGPELPHCIRITLGTHEQNEQLLRHLKAFIEKFKVELPLRSPA